jgi:hypothetical protein
MRPSPGNVKPITRIAMWSGPRNISTAMMRSFGNRPDCTVWDEPFYAFYLQATGIVHPLGEAVIAAGEIDWRAVARRCAEGPEDGSAVFYQKHMTHHLLPQVDRRFLLRLANAFLIRTPERVLASYAAKRAEVTLADIGFLEQAEIFETVADARGAVPPVIDAEDVLEDPRGILSALCAALGLEFREEMLSWRAGPRASDGAWAPHWYGAVIASTGFRRPGGVPVTLAPELQRIAERARPLYQRLARYKLAGA